MAPRPASSQLLTGEPTEVDVIEMAQINDVEGAPEAIDMLSAPLVRRQVWLQTASGQRTAYATSWWEADRVDEFLHNQSLPIGLNVARSRKRVISRHSRDLLRTFRCIGAGIWLSGTPFGDGIICSGIKDNRSR